jgi:hypothetical protein
MEEKMELLTIFYFFSIPTVEILQEKNSKSMQSIFLENC